MLCGDGYLHKNGYTINLMTHSKEFAETFQHILNKWCGAQTKSYKYLRTKKAPYEKISTIRTEWHVSYSSTKAHEFLRGLGKYGKFDWQIPCIVKNGNLQIKGGFIAGFFDSEGNASSYQTYNTWKYVRKSGEVYKGKSKQWNRRIRAYGKRKASLKELQKLLHRLGIISFINYKTDRNMHEIVIYEKKSIRLFARIAGFCIPSKFQRLKQLLTTMR